MITQEDDIAEMSEAELAVFASKAPQGFERSSAPKLNRIKRG
jgi:hypothetical protein